jgi:Tfp pilus assembly protein PilN
MTFNKLYISPHFFPSAFYLVEICVKENTKDLQAEIYQILLNKKKEDIQISKIGTKVGLISIGSFIPKGGFVGVNILGDVIGYEFVPEIDFPEEETEEEWLNEHFIYGSIQEKVFELLFDGKNTHISFIEKTLWDEINTSLTSSNRNVAFIGLNNGGLINYLLASKAPLNQYSLGGNSFSWDGQQLSFLPNDLSDPQNLSFPEHIEKECELAYISFLQFYYQYSNIIVVGYDKEKISLDREIPLVKTFIKKIGAYFLLILLVVLLINTFQFQKSFSAFEILKNKESAISFKLKKLDELQKRYEANKEVVIQANRSSLFSRYSDEIAKILPRKVKLTRMQILPIVDEKLTYTIMDNQIEIQGIHTSHFYYQHWITELKNLSWVKSLNTEYYSLNDKQNKTRFTLLIVLENEK